MLGSVLLAPIFSSLSLNIPMAKSLHAIRNEISICAEPSHVVGTDTFSASRHVIDESQ